MSVDAVSHREGWAERVSRFENAKKAPAAEKPKEAAPAAENTKKTVTTAQKKAAMSNPGVQELQARRKYMAGIHEQPAAKKTSTAKIEQSIDLLA